MGYEEDGGGVRIRRENVPDDLDGKQQRRAGGGRVGRAPEEVREGEEVPDVELEVQGASENDANKVGGKKDDDDVVSGHAHLAVVSTKDTSKVLSSSPLEEEEEGEGRGRQTEEHDAPPKVEEDVFRDELPVDAPDVHELAPEVEAALNVAPGVDQQKGHRQDHLRHCADNQTWDGAPEAETFPKKQEKTRREEEDVHLDGHGQREEKTAQRPKVRGEEVDGDHAQEDRPTVVEQPQHEDAVHATARTKQKERPHWDASSSPVDEQSHGNCRYVETKPDVLRQLHVLTVVSSAVRAQKRQTKTNHSQQQELEIPRLRKAQVRQIQQKEM